MKKFIPTCMVAMLLVLSCTSDEAFFEAISFNREVQINDPEIAKFKTLYENEMLGRSNAITNNNIVWDWVNATKTPENGLIVESLESNAEKSTYRLEIELDQTGKLVGLVYVDTPFDRFTREVALDLQGNILHVKKLGVVKNTLTKDLLPSTATFKEADSDGDWTWDASIGGWALPEVVVTFETNSLNSTNFFNYIDWASVTQYTTTNYSPTGSYTNLSTYYASGSGTYTVVNTNPATETNAPVADPGEKPEQEYADKCAGIAAAWDNYPSNEVAGYVTEDGKVIIVDVGESSYESNLARPYLIEGKSYYKYPESDGAPDLNYTGIRKSYGHYYIPIVASFHTHPPCRVGSNGGNGLEVLSEGDETYAGEAAHITHWAIGCGAVATYDQSGYTEIFHGSLGTLCHLIK